MTKEQAEEALRAEGGDVAKAFVKLTAPSL